MNGLAAAKRSHQGFCRSYPFMDDETANQSTADVNGAGAAPEPIPKPLIGDCNAPIFLEPILPNEGDVD